MTNRVLRTTRPYCASTPEAIALSLRAEIGFYSPTEMPDTTPSLSAFLRSFNRSEATAIKSSATLLHLIPCCCLNSFNRGSFHL